VKVDRPGFALWQLSEDDEIPIEYRAGQLWIEGIDKPSLKKMKQIAKALNARVVDHLGKPR